MPSLPAHESVWDYPRPPRIGHIDWPLKVEDHGRVLAATTRGLRVLEPSATRTFCEWKGQARYWHLRTETGVVEDVCWAYPDPRDERMRDHVSFYAGRAGDARLVGGIDE